ncbi:cytochrome P450 2B5-like [Littorina saxatilis]|uniref:Uncharacterized protein n=1 Tax=Littorina saxatilis TaxID=31220 RepID=A0AAN9BBG3_9CAEN
MLQLLALLASVFETTTVTLFVTVFVVTWLWRKSIRIPPGLPPGPGTALPVLGHLHLLEKDPRKKFSEWREKYGDVFSFYRGGQLVVVLNGYQAIRDALVKHGQDFSGRPHSFLVDRVLRGMGLSGSSGNDNKEQRKVSTEILSHLGMGHSYLQVQIMEEVTHYLQAIEDLNGKPADLSELTHVSISNNICSIVFGKRYDYHDPVFKSCIKAMEEVLYDIFFIENFSFIPLREYLPFDPFRSKAILKRVKMIEDNLLLPCIREQREKLRKKLEKDEEKEDSMHYQNFVEGYLNKMSGQHGNGKKTTVNETYLLKTLFDLWAAGTETSATTVLWVIVHLLRHPHVQDRCHQEVDRVIGADRLPSLQDRTDTVYVEATILETLRLSVNVPFSLPHSVTRDVTFRDYVIPKGTMVLPNLESAMHDPDVWTDPLSFRPERFISPDGTLIKPDEHIPFSLGRRMCMGKSLAQTELYLYVASLLQRFRFLPPEGAQPPSQESILGLTANPEPFKVRAIFRREAITKNT